jgi:protein arginine N-methyltransferase 1
MSSHRLQRLTARFFAALGRLHERSRAWVQKRPALAAWVIPADERSEEDRYREFNGWCFGQFSEQEKMLADQPRMDFYHAAIGRHIQPGDRVIDLGTGTGILAAFAARRGAAKVYAIDHSDILKHARTLAAHNRLRNVDFVAVHSKQFNLPERVDVIVHEQMGDYLFDESMVTNIADLRNRLLKPGGRILPSHFELYCEPMKVRDDRLVPFLWELNVHGYDYSCLAKSRPSEPGYYRLASSDLGVVEHFLGEPEPLLSVDLHTLNEEEMPCDLTFSRTVIHAGRLDGFAVYFRARVDDDLCLTSNPLDTARAPHWGFRILRAERDDFAAGDVIEFNLRIGRWSDPDTWRWSHAKYKASSDTPPAPAALKSS